jgi:FlaA1/EpsC-like NDP-sugar epimerase
MKSNTFPLPVIRNRHVMLIDAFLVVASVLGSYSLRSELNNTFFFYLPSALWMILAGLLIKPAIYYYFGMYRRMWIYASTNELKLLIVSVTAASVLVSAAMIVLASFRVFVGFPRAVLVIDWILSLMAVGGVRLALRLLAETRSQHQAAGEQSMQRKQRILIVGAGDAGAMVLRELQKNPQVNLVPVGFLDDDPAKQKQQIYGTPVIGTLTDMARVLDTRKVDQVVIAIPSAPGRVIRLVADVCRLKSIPFRTIPGMYELLGGKVNVSRLRDVDITDLLRREPAHMEEKLVGASLSNRIVLVSGAGGSIGRELCRQIARWGPAELILLGHGENSIFESLLELRENFPLLPIRAVIADVRDCERLEVVFATHHPQIVFHAAAHKHVPLMEMNVEEAIINNVFGTHNIVEIAAKHHVERLVLISSDKAVRPVNVMGATKRLAEMIVLDAADRYGRAFSIVRFGNVLGSRGSVVPLFKRQIAAGGPVTVTHPDMKRYFMTIPEAVHLVIQAAAMGTGGEAFVLNMGQQVRILDLAEDLIRLSGLEPGRDIEVIFTGIRPGEKLSEDLWEKGHTFSPTAHPDILCLSARSEDLRGEVLASAVIELTRLAREGNAPAILARLDELISGAAIRSTPPPDLNTLF